MKRDRLPGGTGGTDSSCGLTWTDLTGEDTYEAEAVFVAEFDGTITYVNGPFEELFAAAEGDPLGDSLHRYLGLEAESPGGRKMLTRLRDGGSVRRGLRLETAGEERTLLFEAFPFGPSDHRQIVGIYIDRTERERAAAKASLVTEVSRGIGTADTYLSGVETAVEAICTYTEWTYGEVWTPDDDGDCLRFSLGYTDDPSAEAFRAASEDVTFAFGEGLPGRVYESHSAEWMPDASEEPVDVFHRADLAATADLRAAFAVPVVADDTVVSVLAFFLRDRRERDTRLATDICDVVSTLGGLVERKQIEDKLRRQNEQLDRFTRTVSHDLRNPLSVAQGYLGNAQRDAPSEALTKVSTALDRMDELVENLLTLSRDGDVIGDRRLLSLESTATAAWECVDTAEATLRVKAGQIRGDPTRVQQLFENLFRNSVEHGRTDITIRIGPLEPIGTTTRSDAQQVGGFYVEDDGPGIPPEEREAVFNAAYSTGGTGIGLQTVEQIATAHDWTVHCVAGDDGGARFEFITTAAQADSTATADR